MNKQQIVDAFKERLVPQTISAFPTVMASIQSEDDIKYVYAIGGREEELKVIEEVCDDLELQFVIVVPWPLEPLLDPSLEPREAPSTPEASLKLLLMTDQPVKTLDVR